MLQMKKSIIVSTFLLAVPFIALSPSITSAGGNSESCEAIPYINNGSSDSVGSITVTATLNTANQGPGADYYLHQPAFMSWTGDDALDTTLTFNPGITEFVARTSFHDDGWTGSGGKENYNFIASNGGGIVAVFNIRDVDGTFEYSFDEPVTTLAITYSPRSGVYGSFLRMSLPSEINACDPVEALPTWVTQIAPSGAMVFGDDPPTLTPTAVESDDLLTPVALTGTPSCLLYNIEDFEFAGGGIELTSSTPIGTYIVICDPMALDTNDRQYEIIFNEKGEFRVVQSEEDLERPNPPRRNRPKPDVKVGLPLTL